MLDSAPLLHHLIDINIGKYPSITGLQNSISAASLAHFFGVLAWGCVLLIAFAGWGRLTGKILRIRSLPFSVACVSGIATILCIGGWINLLHWIYQNVLLAIVAIGLLLYIFVREEKSNGRFWKEYWPRASFWVRCILVIAFMLMLIRICGTVHVAAFDSFDDGSAYLAFPHKMLELHRFAFDPFSERRVTTSLGGGYLLQAFAISATSLSSISMADRAFGLVLLGGMLFDLGALFGLSTLQLALLELLAYLVPQQAINLTFIMLPVAMLLGMLWMVWRSLQEETSKFWTYALLAGILGGAMISLKSTYLPCVGMFALIPLLIIPQGKSWKRTCSLPVLVGIGALLVMFAWMVSMKQTSGTWLFPILGRGMDYSSYGLFQSAKRFVSTRRMIKIFLQGAALLVLFVIQLFLEDIQVRSKNSSEASSSLRVRFSMAVLAAAAIAITAINYASGGDSIWRYNFPQFFCAVLLYYIVAASIVRMRASSAMARAAFYVSVASLAAMVCYYDAAGSNPRPFREFKTSWSDSLYALRSGLSGQDLEDPQIQAEYRSIEDSLPVNTISLENTAYPFLFNYHRHNILIADWAGAASPTPGWPFQSDSSSLVSYLKQNSVQFIVYDYNYGLWMDAEGCKAIEGKDLNSEWLKEQWLLTILSHNQFNGLRAHYHSVYDDGKVAVIDLNQPVASIPAPSSGWTLATDKNEMCSAVVEKYLAGRPAASAQ